MQTASYSPQTKAQALLELRRRQQERQTQPPSLAGYLATSTGFGVEPWQGIICDRLQRLRFERGQRILFHGPPQHGKSLVISQRFPAWILGFEPTLRIRLACYNETHARRFSTTVRDLMHDDGYRSIFSTTIPDRAPMDEWSTTARSALHDGNPSFKALGLGSGFTGLAADLLIVDDPYKDPQEAKSPAHNVMLWDWWTQVALSRIRPETNVVIMFHRWWEGDFAGRLIEQGGWELLRFPAVADGLAGDPTGRAIGQPLSPRFPLDFLAQKRMEQGLAFEALYQGTPAPASGGLFKQGHANLIDAIPARITRWVRRWDIASTVGGGDYSAGVLMGWRVPGIVTVADVVKGQWGPDERDRVMRETAERDKARYGDVVQIVPQDPGAAGVDLKLHLVRLLAGHRVRAVRETGSKEVRADPLASQWNVGNVEVLKAAWTPAFLDEILVFPNGKHDDQVDAASGAYSALVRRHDDELDDGGSFSYRSLR